MPQYSFPLENTEYTAEQAQLWFATRTTGVYSADDHLIVRAINGMRVALSKGIAWLKIMEFGGIVYGNTETLYFDLAQADGVLKRIDRVVIRFDAIANETTAQIKQGLFSSDPVPPDIERTPGVAFEIAIAEIYINAGAVEIIKANIEDTRLDENLCGIMRDGVTKIPTQTLIDQWESWASSFKSNASKDFNVWFESIKDILDENVAAHLLRKIEEVDTSRWGQFVRSSTDMDIMRTI